MKNGVTMIHHDSLLVVFMTMTTRFSGDEDAHLHAAGAASASATVADGERISALHLPKSHFRFLRCHASTPKSMFLHLVSLCDRTSSHI